VKYRILIVEDDPSYRELLGAWLEAEGHEIVLADSLEAGFVNIAAEPLPDVVLLDIHLGRKNGLTLVHWARRQKHLAHLPIFAITGDTGLRDLKSARDAGCDGCLIKPLQLITMRELLDNLPPKSVGQLP
jgi:two-component system, cell cycle response regulator DivK